jgi:hypothetical protein
MNFLSSVGRFSPGTLTESQKRRRFKIGAPNTKTSPSGRTRKLSTSSTGSTESTKSMSQLSEVSDDYNDDDKLSFEFLPYLKVRAEHFLDDYAKHSHGIMSKEVLNNFKTTGKFGNSDADTVVAGLIVEMKNSTNLKGTNDEKEQKIRDELIKLIKERYNTNLNKKHRITKIHVERLGGRKTRKSKKSKRSTRKHK